MATEEDLEQKVEDLKEALTKIEDLIDDAKMVFEQAFEGGYELLERRMNEGFEKLDAAKAEM